MSGDSFADAAAAHEYQAVCQARGDAGQPQRAMRKPEYDRRYGQSRPKGVSRSASAAVPDALAASRRGASARIGLRAGSRDLRGYLY